MRDISVQLTHYTGELARVAAVLSQHRVNLTSLTGLAIGPHVTIRLIPDDIDAARAAFDAAGIRFQENEIVQVLLEDRGTLAPLHSVFPADSIPAWITIYTGRSPDEHGVIQSIDYLKRDFRSFTVDLSAFQGATFWDEASRRGKRVCVVNPFLAYPSWQVNGVMASGPVFVGGETSCSPPEALVGVDDVPPLGGIVDFPTRKTLAAFVDKTFADTRALARSAATASTSPISHRLMDRPLGSEPILSAEPLIRSYVRRRVKSM